MYIRINVSSFRASNRPLQVRSNTTAALHLRKTRRIGVRNRRRYFSSSAKLRPSEGASHVFVAVCLYRLRSGAPSSVTWNTWSGIHLYLKPRVKVLPEIEDLGVLPDELTLLFPSGCASLLPISHPYFVQIDNIKVAVEPRCDPVTDSIFSPASKTASAINRGRTRINGSSTSLQPRFDTWRGK